MKVYKRIYNTPEYRKRYVGIYGSWYAMKQRCGNKNNLAFKNYGGRGITYDKNWENFANFKKEMGNNYKDGLTLDRINNNGNYCKENCRWVSRKTQMNNTRINTYIKFKGETKTISEWADITGLKYHTLLFRYLRKWGIERMLNPNLERPWKLKI